MDLFLLLTSPNDLLRRGFYASMFAAALVFEMTNMLFPGYHRALMDKNKINYMLFYLLDIIIHWLPLQAFYEPPLDCVQDEFVSKIVAFAFNLFWGLLISGWTLDLSNVYSPLNVQDWYILWVLVFVLTLAAP